MVTVNDPIVWREYRLGPFQVIVYRWSSIPKWHQVAIIGVGILIIFGLGGLVF